MKVVCASIGWEECIDSLPYLTLGKVYDVIEYPPTQLRRDTIYRFIDDKDQLRSLDAHKELFITLNEWRQKQLNNLLQ